MLARNNLFFPKAVLSGLCDFFINFQTKLCWISGTDNRLFIKATEKLFEKVKRIVGYISSVSFQKKENL